MSAFFSPETSQRTLVLALVALLGPGAGCYTGLSGVDGRDSDPGPDRQPSDGAEDDEDESTAMPRQALHRLNRLEYDNTVRDLLGTELRPAAGFGPDPEANGFDNMAEQLGMSPVLLDAYETAAHEVIADALDPRPTFRARFGADELSVQGGYPVGELWALTGTPASVQIEVPQGGDHELVLFAGASTIGPAPEPVAALQVDGTTVASFTVQGSAANPQDHVVPVVLEPGPHTIQVVPTNWVNDAVANTSNNVMVAALTVRSVEITIGPGHDLVYVCEPSEALTPEDAHACYEDIIAHFAFRAWRRPLTADEEDSLRELWASILAHEETEEDALRLVMRAVMLSPKFVYRARTTADDDDGEWLDDYVLASRLSYFLWSSMPDDQLFEMAAQGRLATDEGLSEAVARMLEDDKAQALVDGFAEQWLSVRHLATASPSPEIYPDFDEPLRAAMGQESKLLFQDYLSNGEPVASMLQPGFTYRNDRLAEHYELPPVGSEELVRVEVTDDERQGVLALGAWLTAQSDAEHPSPIRRGRWLSDRLLCSPVPPPPPGLEIPPIEGGGGSVREQLERHRSDPTCAACHSLLDVLGMGLQEFDGTGGPRKIRRLDTMGELPDGRTFEGAGELAELYAEDETFTACLTQKLYSYSLGRPIRPADLPDLETIGLQVASEAADLHALIDAIVHSPAFRSPAPLEEP